MHLHRVELPTKVTRLIASQEGDLILEMRANWERDSDVIISNYDLDGKLVWKKDLHAHFPKAVKLASDGMLWMSDGEGLVALDLKGVLQQEIDITLRNEEYIGGFLIVPDGFYLCTRVRNPGMEEDIDPRVIFVDKNGSEIWSTILDITPVENEGLVEAGIHTNWGIQPKKPFRPPEWKPSRVQPLLLSAHALLATYFDLSSGLSISYCLDATKGALLWQTPSIPDGNKIIAPNGDFLIGAQGYGAIDTWLYGRDGEVKQHWDSHGYIVVSEQGELRVMEIENIKPSKMRFAVLEADGTIRKGPHLDQYRTAYPIIDCHDNTVFWREGNLFCVDAELNKQNLFTVPLEHPAHLTMYSRLLLIQGKIISAISTHGGKNELWVFDTDFGPLAKSSWACAHGNIEANPVYLE